MNKEVEDFMKLNKWFYKHEIKEIIKIEKENKENLVSDDFSHVESLFLLLEIKLFHKSVS